MKVGILGSVFLSVLIAGCGQDVGPDSISTHQAATPAAECNAVCHSSTSTFSPDPLQTNGSGAAGKHIVHVSTRGIYCTKCHLDYENQPTHLDTVLDTGDPLVLLTFFDATNLGGSWVNDTGPNTGTCVSTDCHRTAAPDWYDPTPSWTLPPCATCHGTAPAGTTRQVLGTGGDFAANAAILSHHVAGGTDPVDNQCLVCHELSNHMAGIVRLANADTGAGIAYEPSNPATLEPFCLSCHDTDGAAFTSIGVSSLDPFNDGRTLGVIPNVAGNKIEGYWNNAYTIHKDNGLTCAGTGDPSTGCHGNDGTANMHGSITKGLLTKNMNFQIPLTFDSNPLPPVEHYDYDNYQLCFDCHEYYPAVSKNAILGYQEGGNYDIAWAPTPYFNPSGIQSLFRDRYFATTDLYPAYWGITPPAPGPLYNLNDSFYISFFTTPTHLALHNYHLIGGGFIDWLSWKYRGDSSQVGRITCTTCHNVHGTSGTVRSTYEAFGITSEMTGLGPDLYKTFTDLATYENEVMTVYPINCNISCHGMMGITSYWYTPSDE